MAAIHNGVKPVWSSEIEKFPLAVTKHHFPDVIQLGDVTKIDGAAIPPVDIICAGSPCQDLSVAGKREGLKGERSGLFRTAVSIVRRMRMSTGGRQPRFFVWENVPGAFSSNKGLDFKAVLEEIGQTTVPMPLNGKWAENGMAQLPGCEIAWRILDAQWWVPQRRKRIFLVADFGPGKPCAKEILFVEPSVCGNFEKGESERKEIAGSVEDGLGTPIVLRMRGGCDGGGKGALLSENKSLTLAANANDQTVFCIAGNMVDRETHQHGLGISENVSSTLTSADRHAVAYDVYKHHNWRESEVLGPLTTHGNGVRGDTPLVADMSIVGGQIVYENHAQDYRLKETKVVPTLGVNPTRNPTLITEITPNNVMSPTGGQSAYAIGNGQTAQLKMQDKVGTLNCMHDQIAVMQECSPVAEDK